MLGHLNVDRDKTKNGTIHPPSLAVRLMVTVSNQELEAQTVSSADIWRVLQENTLGQHDVTVYFI